MCGQSLHLPGEASSENGGEHQVVGGEEAPVEKTRISLGDRLSCRRRRRYLPVECIGEGL